MTEWQRLILSPEDTIRVAMQRIDEGTLRVALVVDAEHHLLGTVVDGDIRRALLRRSPWTTPVSEVMYCSPSTAGPDATREQLLSIMQERDINHVPIVGQDGRVVGLETLHRLIDTGTRSTPVFLLAGGLGERLRPLTESVPKPMLQVGDKPILERSIERLERAGFRQLYISVRYKAHLIREHFGAGERWGVKIGYVREQIPLGTAGPLGLLDDRPDHPILVMNGDILTDVDYGHLLDYHSSSGALATMCVREYDFQVPFGAVETADGRVTRVVEKPVHRFQVSAGIYVIEPEVIDRIDRGEFLDMPDLLNRLIDESETVVVFPIHEYWIDIGQSADLEKARSDTRELGDSPARE